MSRAKTIGGEGWNRVYTSYTTKKRAREVAAMVRKDGRRARVIKEGNVYWVYTPIMGKPRSR